MEERLVRNRVEDQMPPMSRRLLRIGGALVTGGFNAFSRLSDEEIAEIEDRGFDAEGVQNYLDELERGDERKEAAMLRGAFNDLLGRLEEAERYEPDGNL